MLKLSSAFTGYACSNKHLKEASTAGGNDESKATRKQSHAGIVQLTLWYFPAKILERLPYYCCNDRYRVSDSRVFVSALYFMKLPTLLFSLPVLALCAAGQHAIGQAPSSLNIQPYAGLSITGTVGRVYTVQYTTNLAQTNWTAAGFVPLPHSPYLWLDTSAPATEQRFYRTIEGPTNMVWLLPGTFTMGSPSNEIDRIRYEGPQTVVTLTRGFFIGKYELTQGEYVDVMQTNPSYFRNGSPPPFGGSGDAVTNELRHPVEQVAWADATNYCGKLTKRERTAGRLPIGWAYRLPTDAEWEYACRAGSTTAFHYGPALRSGMANFDGSMEYDSQVGTTNNPNGISIGRTTIVGSYEPNIWGLYDMHANVYEWCWDRWSEALPGGHVLDPRGPTSGVGHVIRSGMWRVFARTARSGARLPPSSINEPFFKSFTLGFRVVLAAGE